MDRLIELTEYLVKSIVKDTENVSVKQFDDNLIEVLVNNDDMAMLIGKKGAVATSLRNIVQTAAYTNGIEGIRINFDSF